MTIQKNEDGSITAITNDQQPREGFLVTDVQQVAESLLLDMMKLGMIKAGVIVGSVRRGKAIVKDLEFLVVPKMGPSKLPPAQGGLFNQGQPGPDVNLFNELIPIMLDVTPLEAGDKDGPKLKTFLYPWPDQLGSKLKVEVYQVAHESAWGVQMMIRTGPVDFNKFLMSYILKKGWHSSDGFLHGHRKGLEGSPNRGRCDKGPDCPLLISCPTEESFFAAVGLDYILPGLRFEDTLKAAVRTAYKKAKMD